MMVVSVSFHGIQRQLTRRKRLQISLSDGSQVSQVIDYVQKRFPELPIRSEALLITVNGCVSTKNQELKQEDQISLLPHIGGG
jgi:molybdopterin converting factor small subunit